MLDFNLLSLFFMTSIILALAPGPDNLFVLAQAAQHGKKAGLLVTLGLCTGILFHTTAVSLGLAAVFAASTMAFTLLKVAGIGYLLYLAWLSFRAGAETGEGNRVEQLTPGQLYSRGVIMNITNPKVSIFFLAFLPQFVDPLKGPLTFQFLMLGGLFIVATILIFGAISLLAGAVGDRFRRSASAQKILNWGAGAVFVGLALKLATSQR
jgi:threonine/homoserine/homoserine lactone efflux protein